VALSSEGLLCRWALAIQEYDFHISYKKGSLNSNADALSRRDTQAGHCAVTVADATPEREQVHAKQQQEPVTKQIYTGLKDKVTPRSPDWQSPLCGVTSSCGLSSKSWMAFSADSIHHIQAVMSSLC